jgi:hypothetical protein
MMIQLRLIFIDPHTLIKKIKPLNLIPKKNYIEAMEYICFPENFKNSNNVLFKERKAKSFFLF